MKIVAIWCRTPRLSIIGIGDTIPWDAPNDLMMFKRITYRCTLIMGRKTYESLPNRNLENRKIIVVTRNPNYQVINPEYHETINDIEDLLKLKKFTDDPNLTLYVSGGSTVYYQFMSHPTLRPDWIVDSVYIENDDLENNIANVQNAVDISASVKLIPNFYHLISFSQDSVTATYLYRQKCDMFNHLDGKVQNSKDRGLERRIRELKE